MHRRPSLKLEVSLQHIRRTAPDGNPWETQGCADTKSCSAKLTKDAMGDPYRLMEVSIHIGDYKGHHGVVLGTHERAGEVFVDVRTTDCVVNAEVTYQLGAVRERR